MPVDTALTFEFRDEYNRKPIAEKVIRLLESDVNVSPLVIDGGWGTGKSEFCHKLINLLESDENTTLSSVYVDAFKADHADEPLMTLLAAVLKLLPEAEQKSLIEKALPAIRFGTKTVLKSAVSWVLKQEVTDIADDFEGVLQDASDDAINHSIEAILEGHVKADESIEALRAALIELTKDKPIVVFVDELDRCRPDFAISMLESIKHIFDVDGVQFVLVVNTDQLKVSVNHCYGIAVDGQKYLDKFIGYRFNIPNLIDRSVSEHEFSSQNHFHSLIFGSTVLNKSVIADNHEVMVFVKELIGINNLSLREVETFHKYLEVYQVITGGQDLRVGVMKGYSFLIILGVYLVCFHHELFNVNSEDMLDLTVLLRVLNKHDLYLDDPYKSGVSPKYHEIVAAMCILERVDDISSEGQKSWKRVVD